MQYKNDNLLLLICGTMDKTLMDICNRIAFLNRVSNQRPEKCDLEKIKRANP
jgi:hypothetical protein